MSPPLTETDVGEPLEEPSELLLDDPPSLPLTETDVGEPLEEPSELLLDDPPSLDTPVEVLSEPLSPETPLEFASPVSTSVASRDSAPLIAPMTGGMIAGGVIVVDKLVVVVVDVVEVVES